MPYSLDELAKDIKGILKDHGIQEGSDKVCYYVQKALMDQSFIHNNLKDRDDQNPREILYEDPELGFVFVVMCIIKRLMDHLTIMDQAGLYTVKLLEKQK